MKRCVKVGVWVGLWLFGMMGVPSAQAILIVDTGAGFGNSGTTLDDYTPKVAGLFSVSDAYTIRSIEGHYYPATTGTVNIRLYSSNGLPDQVLFSTRREESVISYVPDWRGVSGLDWSITPGDYYISFELNDIIDDYGIYNVNQSFSFPGLIHGQPIPNPIPTAGYYSFGSFGYQWSLEGGIAAAVRIDADLTSTQSTSSVPEPVTMALWSMGTMGLVAVRRKRAVS